MLLCTPYYDSRARTAARLCVAGILLVSTLSKTVDQAEATSAHPSWSSGLGIVILFEAALATWIIAGVLAAAADCCAMLLFCAFAGVSVAKVVNLENSCGCFGSFIVVPPLAMFVVDILVIVACGMSWYMRCIERQTSFCSPWYSRLLVVCLAFSLSVYGYRSEAGYRHVVVDMHDSKQWVGRQFPIRLTTLPDTLLNGRWSILLYSPG